MIFAGKQTGYLPVSWTPLGKPVSSYVQRTITRFMPNWRKLSQLSKELWKFELRYMWAEISTVKVVKIISNQTLLTKLENMKCLHLPMDRRCRAWTFAGCIFWGVWKGRNRLVWCRRRPPCERTWKGSPRRRRSPGDGPTLCWQQLTPAGVWRARPWNVCKSCTDPVARPRAQGRRAEVG